MQEGKFYVKLEENEAINSYKNANIIEITCRITTLSIIK